jgi:hypothetical protein
MMSNGGALPPEQMMYLTFRARASSAEREAYAAGLERTLERLADQLGTPALSSLLAGIELAAVDEPLEAGEDAVVGRLGTPELGAETRAALATSALERGVARRRQLLAGALTAPQVAARLGLRSRETPHQRHARGELLAVREGGVWRFPLAQFDDDAPDGVLPGLRAVLAALDDLTEIRKLLWLSTPRPELDGRTPFEAMRRGDAEAVASHAYAAGASA